MNAVHTAGCMMCSSKTPCISASEVAPARGTLHSPVLVADWQSALFLHFQVSSRALQECVPFELDLWEGCALVSLVAFTMRRMRPARGGRIAEWFCRPLATHEFLNLRTYVRVAGEPGICFLSEWLPNRLSLVAGPILYSLPYRLAAIRYVRRGLKLTGKVAAREGVFFYVAELASERKFAPCCAGSRDEFLLERYAAFNAGHLLSGKKSTARVFRVGHVPWLQAPVNVRRCQDDLLRAVAPWWRRVECVGANYSPGVQHVLMSAPRRID